MSKTEYLLANIGVDIAENGLYYPSGSGVRTRPTPGPKPRSGYDIEAFNIEELGQIEEIVDINMLRVDSDRGQRNREPLEIPNSPPGQTF